MTLPSTGLITLAMVNTELRRAEGAAISLNDADVRELAGIASGQIGLGDLLGKSATVAVVPASWYTSSSSYGWGYNARAGTGDAAIGAGPFGSLSKQPVSDQAMTAFVWSVSASGRGIIEFQGNVVSWLTGKTLLLDGVEQTITGVVQSGTYTRGSFTATAWTEGATANIAVY